MAKFEQPHNKETSFEKLAKVAKPLVLAMALSSFFAREAAADESIDFKPIDVVKTAVEGQSKEERRERLRAVLPEFIEVMEKLDAKRAAELKLDEEKGLTMLADAQEDAENYMTALLDKKDQK